MNLSIRELDPRASRRALLASLVLASLLPVHATAQTAAPGERGKPSGGSAEVIAPATAVVGARAGRAGARLKKEPSSGRVVGILTDAATGEPLIGGQIGVQGLPLGNVSDDTGAYFINNVPVGKQTFSVEYLGYESQSKVHEVQGGASTTLDFALNATPIQLAGVVVEEEIILDLSEYVSKTALPTFQAEPVRDMDVEKSDTSAMEEWHRSMKDFVSVHSIEYPMAGVRVYYRLPPVKRHVPETMEAATAPSDRAASDPSAPQSSPASTQPSR